MCDNVVLRQDDWGCSHNRLSISDFSIQSFHFIVVPVAFDFDVSNMLGSRFSHSEHMTLTIIVRISSRIFSDLIPD